ncbi:MAG: hypothetical protein AB4426_10550 [Xenococcaceae cyanobacterium]
MDSQMWQDYLKQWALWQQKMLDNWRESWPTKGEAWTISSLVEPAINYQEKTVGLFLEIQEKNAQVYLDTQKLLWQDYLKGVKKEPVVSSN